MHSAPLRVLPCWLLVLALIFCACRYGDVSGLVKPQEKAVAEKVISQLQGGELDSLSRMLSPSLKDSNTTQLMNQLYCLVPKDKPTELRYTKFSRQLGGAKPATYLTVQATHGSSVAFYSMGISGEGPNVELLQFRVDVVPRQSQISGPVLLRTMVNPLRFVFAAMVFVIPLLTIYSIVLLFRTKNLRRRWGWFIFMLLGVGQFKLDWFAGAVSAQLLSVQPLGASFFAETAYGPLFVSISVPLGAILFLLKRKSLRPSVVNLAVSDDQGRPQQGESQPQAGGA